tara:strand:+ start:471 stop:935 length:465 start_codon:yes stop_codon:yes gene_type:complete
MNLRDRLKQCNLEGQKTEERFKQLMDAKGKWCLPSTKEQNIYDHIDFWIGEVGVDVKGNRHLECCWLELKNVIGKDGWLKGNADYIVMDIIELKSFIFFLRTDLLDYCQKITETTNDKKEFNKFYTRAGRKDLLVKVRYDDIKHLKKGVLNYEH